MFDASEERMSIQDFYIYICVLIFKEKNSNIIFKEKFKNYKKKGKREYRRIRLNGVMHVRTVKFKVESK